MVLSTVQVSLGDGAGGAGGGEVRKAVVAGAPGVGGAKRDAGERMSSGSVARSILAWAASSCASECDAPGMRGAANQSPRPVSRILSASMVAAW